MMRSQKKQLKTLIKNQSQVTVSEDNGSIIVTRGKFSQCDVFTFKEYHQGRKALDEWIPCNKFSNVTKNLFGILHGIYIHKTDFKVLKNKLGIGLSYHQIVEDGFFNLDQFKMLNLNVDPIISPFYLGSETWLQDKYIHCTQIEKKRGFNGRSYKCVIGETIRHLLCGPAVRWSNGINSYYLYGAEVFSESLKSLQEAKFNSADLFIYEEDPFETGTSDIVANAIWDLIDIRDETLEVILNNAQIEDTLTSINTDLIL